MPMKKISSWLMLVSMWLCASVAHAGTVTYVYTDPQGTPLAEADASGNITARFEYTPYGVSVPSMGAAPNGVGYTGHVNDPESGLVYMQARYYDPVVGRFLSVDPVGVLEDSLLHFNRYIYGYNNPVKFNDPDGRCPFCVPLAVAGRVAASAAIGAAIEVGVQMAFEGKSLSEVDTSDVAVAAAVSGALPGMGSLALRIKTAAPIVQRSVKAIKILSSQSRNTASRATKLAVREAQHVKKVKSVVADTAEIAAKAASGVALKHVGQEAFNQPPPPPPPPPENN